MLTDIQQETIVNGGGTLTLNVASNQKRLIVLRGVATLSSGYTVQPSGVPASGKSTSFLIYYDGNATTAGANVITVFGTVLSTEAALKGKCYIVIVYDPVSTSWRVTILPGYQTLSYQGVETTAVVLTGTTINITKNSKNTHRITGTGALTGDVSATPSGGGFYDGQPFLFYHEATLDIGAASVNYLGELLSEEEALAGSCAVLCTYDALSGTFLTQLIPSVPAAPQVTNTIYVSLNGDDATGLINRPDRPFRNPAGAAVAAAWPTLSPTSSNRPLLEMAPGNYTSDDTLVLPDRCDIQMNNATLQCDEIANPTIEFLGRSFVTGKGGAIVHSIPGGTAVYAAGGAAIGTKVEVATIRGLVDMDINGGTFIFFVDTITPENSTATAAGINNWQLKNGDFTVISGNCFSSIEASAGAFVRIYSSVLKNGCRVLDTATLTLENNKISRDRIDISAAIITVSATAALRAYNNRIKAIDSGGAGTTLSGIKTTTNTTDIIVQGNVTEAGTGAFGIENSSGGSINIRSYGGNVQNKAVGGASAIVFTVGAAPTTDALVIV